MFDNLSCRQMDRSAQGLGGGGGRHLPHAGRWTGSDGKGRALGRSCQGGKGGGRGKQGRAAHTHVHSLTHSLTHIHPHMHTQFMPPPPPLPPRSSCTTGRWRRWCHLWRAVATSAPPIPTPPTSCSWCVWGGASLSHCVLGGSLSRLHSQADPRAVTLQTMDRHTRTRARSTDHHPTARSTGSHTHTHTSK